MRRPQLAPLVAGELQAAPGLLVGGPWGEPAGGMPVYRDDWQAAGNEVSLDWQASWACYLSLLVAGPR